MAGRYTGSYLDRFNGWHAVAILAEIGFTRRTHPRDHYRAAVQSLTAAHGHVLC